MAETLLFGLNGLNDHIENKAECMNNRTNNRIYYNQGKVQNTIIMNPFEHDDDELFFDELFLW